MRLLGKGRVYLEKGETVPVICKCGHIYQPDVDSFASVCRKCGNQNLHEEQQPFTKC